MEVMWFTIPISLLLAFSFVAFFTWATLKNQWEDLDLCARRNIIDSNTNDHKEDRSHVERS